MTARSHRTVAAAVLVLAAGTAVHGTETGPGLPPAECVRMLRGARLAAVEGDAARELELLRAAVERFPGEIAALYALVDHGRRHPLPVEERRTILARLREVLADPARPLAAGVVHRIANDPEVDDESLALFAEGAARRTAGADGEQAADWLAVLAQLDTRLGRLEAATSTLERLWRLTPTDEVAWSLLRLYLELDRDREAAALMDSSAALRQAVPQTYVRLLIDTGLYDEAIRHTEEMLAGIEGEDRFAARFLVGVAWSLRDAGRDREAEPLFRRALELDPENPQPGDVLLHLYADPEERRERAAEAARRWEREEDAQALLDEGTQRLAAGDAAGALELLERAAPHFPDLEPAWFNLGMAAYQAERWATVERAFTRAAELKPDRAASHYFRGLALVHLGRCRDAVTALERSVELDADRYQAHYYLAGCYTELGDSAAAARHRTRYQAAKPQ